MNDHSVTTNEIIEFLQEHMVTKAEMNDFAKRTDLDEMKSDVLISVDRFVKLHETLDLEIVALRGKYDQLEERIEIVEQKLGLASM